VFLVNAAFFICAGFSTASSASSFFSVRRYAMHSAVCGHGAACLSVRPSVTFVYSIETSKRILRLFHLLIPHNSSFSIRNIMTKFRWAPLTGVSGSLNGSIECRWSMKKSLYLENDTR